MFKYKWVDENMGMRTNDYNFTLVVLNKMGYTNKPFVLTHQARRQIFYVNNPSNDKWSMVLKERNIH